jgi:cellulose synthase/poly-beta-1,6-N-acetylglucosamine synthase-like glycosyltransferase
MTEVIVAAAGILPCVSTLPGTVELLVLTIAGSLHPRAEGNGLPRVISRIAVVVPAHNEEDGVADTFTSLRRCLTANSPHTIVVVADNCDDRTADRARSSGARVLVACNSEIGITFGYSEALKAW